MPRYEQVYRYFLQFLIPTKQQNLLNVIFSSIAIHLLLTHRNAITLEHHVTPTLLNSTQIGPSPCRHTYTSLFPLFDISANRIMKLRQIDSLISPTLEQLGRKFICPVGSLGAINLGMLKSIDLLASLVGSLPTD